MSDVIRLLAHCARQDWLKDGEAVDKALQDMVQAAKHEHDAQARALKTLKTELADAEGLAGRLGEILCKTVDALKGPHPDGGLWSTHDLPEIAQGAVAKAVLLSASLNQAEKEIRDASVAIGDVLVERDAALARAEKAERGMARLMSRDEDTADAESWLNDRCDELEAERDAEIERKEIALGKQAAELAQKERTNSALAEENVRAITQLDGLTRERDAALAREEDQWLRGNEWRGWAERNRIRAESAEAERDTLRALVGEIVTKVRAAADKRWLPLEDQGGWPNELGDLLTRAEAALKGDAPLYSDKETAEQEKESSR